MQYALVQSGAVASVLVVGARRQALFRAPVAFTLLDAAGAEIAHYPADVFTGRWSDAERQAVGIVPLETAEQQGFDPARHDWAAPTFEVKTDRVIERLDYAEKSNDVLSAQAEAAKESRRAALKAEMLVLEAGQGRALREAALGRDGAGERLAALDTAIGQKRAELAAI